MTKEEKLKILVAKAKLLNDKFVIELYELIKQGLFYHMLNEDALYVRYSEVWDLTLYYKGDERFTIVKDAHTGSKWLQIKL